MTDHIANVTKKVEPRCGDCRWMESHPVYSDGMLCVNPTSPYYNFEKHSRVPLGRDNWCYEFTPKEQTDETE